MSSQKQNLSFFTYLLHQKISSTYHCVLCVSFLLKATDIFINWITSNYLPVLSSEDDDLRKIRNFLICLLQLWLHPQYSFTTLDISYHQFLILRSTSFFISILISIFSLTFWSHWVWTELVSAKIFEPFMFYILLFANI